MDLISLIPTIVTIVLGLVGLVGGGILLKKGTKTIDEFKDLVTEIDMALQDKKLTEEEWTKIRKEWDELKESWKTK